MKKYLELLKSYLARFIKWLPGVFTQRLGLKVASLILALLIWTYIINNNSSLTRNKLITGVSVSAGPASTLSGYSLSVATDVVSEYQGAVDVTVELPQSRYAGFNINNLKLTPDYSAVRTAGTYNVPVSAISAYGNVVKLSPSSIRVEIENTDSRNLSTEVELIGENTDAYWYNVDTSVLNPAQITVSGAASIVQKVAHVVAQVDVTDRTANFRRSTQVLLTDSDGNVLSTSLLNKSSSTCLVRVEIYPKKTLGVYVDPAQLKLKEGYEVTDISFMPSTITVAAESELLAGLEYLPLEIAESDGEISAGYTSRMSFAGLDEFRYASSRSVYMTVSVAEKTLTRVFTEVPVEINVPEGTLEEGTVPVCDVTVTGPYWTVKNLTNEDLVCTAKPTDDGGFMGAPVTITAEGIAPDMLTFTASDITIELMDGVYE